VRFEPTTAGGSFQAAGIVAEFRRVVKGSVVGSAGARLYDAAASLMRDATPRAARSNSTPIGVVRRRAPTGPCLHPQARADPGAYPVGGGEEFAAPVVEVVLDVRVEFGG